LNGLARAADDPARGSAGRPIPLLPPGLTPRLFGPRSSFPLTYSPPRDNPVYRVLGQRIAAPADLAKILAAQSSEAKKALPDDRRFGSCATRGASQREDRPMARGASQVDFEAALQDPQAFFAE